MRQVVVSLAVVFLPLSIAHSDEGNEEPAPPVAPGARQNREREYATGDWDGRRTALADRGVVFHFTYTAEGFGVVSGGIQRGVLYEGLLDLGTDIDLEKLAGWEGGRFHVNGLYPHGGNGSANYVGDLGTFSNIEAYNSYRLYELWLEQSFFEDRFSLRAGAITFDSEFAIMDDYGSLFVQSGFGTPGVLGANLPLPAYPDAALGVRLRIEPTAGLTIRAAVFDGNVAPGLTPDHSPRAAPSNEFNRYGTHWALRKDEGAQCVLELGCRVNEPPDEEPPVGGATKDERPPRADGKAIKAERGLAGSYKAGFVYHTDSFADIHDVTLSRLRSSLARAVPRDRGADYAVYVNVEQEFWREPESEAQGLGAFFQAAWMPPDRNLVELSIESGLHYRGPFPGRDNDALGVGVAFLKISDRVADAVREANRQDRTSVKVPDFEATLELDYRYEVAPWFSIQPHIQYVIHPGGTGEHDNAVIIGARMTVVF